MLDMGAAKKQLNEMHSRITLVGIKTLIWYFNKIFRHAIQGLHVEENSLQKIKQVLSDNKRVVLMPIYKSFADAFIYTYIHHHYKMDHPFMIGNLEDTPRIKLFESWLKAAGYIFSRRSFN